MMGSNFETNIMKVNDGNGNPIEIASVIVWRVFDPAKAILSLESYRNFVEQQSESAVREVSGEYPYEKNINGVADDEEGNSMSLTKNRNDIEEILTRTLNNHMNKYGIQVINASFSHLSYAPEIASAMLQRQQAGAIVSARKIIVSASTSMVDDVISHYEKEGSKIDFTNEEKSKLASNLIVVLCSQQDVTPTLPLSRNDHS
jgi:regulator of protease activity HflC (stomatin/prohibitin superfamily)